MTHWVTALATMSDNLIQSQDPACGQKEPTSESCHLTSTCVIWHVHAYRQTHTYTHTINKIMKCK